VLEPPVADQDAQSLGSARDRPFVGFGFAWTQHGDGDRVFVHVQAEVRSVVRGRSTSVCGSSRGPTARDPRILSE